MNNSNDIFNKLKETQVQIKQEKENLLNKEVEEQKKRNELLQEKHLNYISKLEEKNQELSGKITELEKQNEEILNTVSTNSEFSREDYKNKYNLSSNFTLVSNDGTGDFDSLQDAINNSKNGDCIFVKYGTYYLNRDKTVKKYHAVTLGTFPSSKLKIIGEINNYGMVPIVIFDDNYFSFHMVTLMNLDIKTSEEYGTSLGLYESACLENINTVGKIEVDFIGGFLKTKYIMDMKKSNISRFFTCSNHCIINLESCIIDEIDVYKAEHTVTNIKDSKVNRISRKGLSKVTVTKTEYVKVKDSIIGRLLRPIKKIDCQKIMK